MADEKSARALLAHQLGTYHSLRIVLATIGFALPVAVAAAGWWQCQLPAHLVDGSLSAYYHRTARFEFLTARDLLVGGLLGAAACLYAYKGYSWKENVALNLAAVFAIGVALVPTGHGKDALNAVSARASCIVFMGNDYADASLRLKFHAASALFFFLCLAYVSIRRARDTVRNLPTQAMRDWYNRGYVVAGSVMFLSPVIAILVSLLATGSHVIFIFCVETAGVWAFSGYWLLKTFEMSETKLDIMVAQEKMERVKVRPQPPTGALDKAMRAIQGRNAGLVERVVPVEGEAGTREKKAGHP